MSRGKEFTEEERLEIIEKTLDNLRHGLPEYKAAVDAGASFETWFRWRESIPGLIERTKDAKRGRVPLIEDALYKAALSGKVLACLAILEKEDIGWRNRAKEIAPQQAVFVFQGGPSSILSFLNEAQKNAILTSMVSLGHLPSNIKTIDVKPGGNNNGSSGNGKH